ncbi:ABC transporter ATP-binding protein [Terrimonas pollutisoli]|uniref:ABC transporter ATP-binding protein n=1 Tax=Terrimonas pollutisoli TaxID=3034147 RepID=UPI0023ED8856|nr:ABC transporter ATP-binding protein [Terrimonas sp. H1YJ31]
MTNIGVIKRLLGYVSCYRIKLIALILVAMIGVSFEVVKPLPIKIVIDNVLAGHPLPAFLQDITGLTMPGGKRELLLFCIIAIVFVTIGGTLVSLIVSNMTVGLAQKLVYDISVDLFSKLQQLSLSFYSKNKVGDLLQRVTGDAFVIYFLVAQIIIPAITSLICLVAMFYIMSRIDMQMAIIAMAVVPLLAATLAYFSRPMNDTTMSQYKKQGDLSAFLQQSLSSIKIIQAFARESYMHGKLQDHAWDFGKAFQKATKVSTKYNQLITLITGLASAVLIGMGAYRGMNGNLSAGDLYIFLGYVTALYGPVNSLSTAVGTAVIIGSRGKRLFEILDSNEIVKEKVNPHSLKNVRGEIAFENVQFGYEDSTGKKNVILQDINFRTQPGQITAIVGPTGAGKTSLISMIARFYDPVKGRVTIDGFDLRNVQLHSLRENISLVLQESFLFPMTIRENIAFGKPGASFQEIMEAAKAAQAHDFIMRMPLQYDTPVSEMGSSLSGGEKQRIALARAFLKKASILILDEPTSALDALTESRIFKKLPEIAKDKTIFLISHRLSTIKHADQIITLQNGYVVETGTHENLMQQGNLYADLYKYQHIT